MNPIVAEGPLREVAKQLQVTGRKFGALFPELEPASTRQIQGAITLPQLTVSRAYLTTNDASVSLTAPAEHLDISIITENLRRLPADKLTSFLAQVWLLIQVLSMLHGCHADIDAQIERRDLGAKLDQYISSEEARDETVRQMLDSMAILLQLQGAGFEELDQRRDLPGPSSGD